MIKRKPLLKLFTLSAVVLALTCVSINSAPTQAQEQSERERAIALYEANNFLGALPLLEKLALAAPEDIQIISRLGFSLFAASTAEKDTAKRQKLRERAKQLLLKSQALGDNSNLTMITLDGLAKDDDTAVPFSNLKAADSEIRNGEAAFVRGDFDAALAAYKRAMDLDPKLYEAALYAGDVEFKVGFNSKDEHFRSEHFAQAGVWFAKAIAIDPDRETAYRYWGDLLDAEGKIDEARDKFIDAIVAEPYGRRSYVGLMQWGERHDVKLGHPRIEIPTNVSSSKPGEINVTVSDLVKGKSDDGSAAWLMYGLIRASWMDRKGGGRSEQFAKAYPTESAYRHSLAEEVQALRGVVESVQVQTKDQGVKQLTPSLDNLVKLHNAGLIEPYVLFVKPDEGISRDYPAYRKANRDKLRRYWLEIAMIRD